jgi:hypothetical protein
VLEAQRWKRVWCGFVLDYCSSPQEHGGGGPVGFQFFNRASFAMAGGRRGKTSLFYVGNELHRRVLATKKRAAVVGFDALVNPPYQKSLSVGGRHLFLVFFFGVLLLFLGFVVFWVTVVADTDMVDV